MNFNKIILAGNVSSDVEMRYTPSNKPVTSFNMAINEGYGENQKAMFVRVTCWEKLAETVAQYLEKGQGVLVEGRLAPARPYVRKDGELAASNEITAFSVQFGQKSSKSESGEGQPRKGDAAPAQPAVVDDEAIPF